MAKKQSKKRLRQPRPADDLSCDAWVLQQAMTAGSDLSCALIGGAAIENMLMFILEQFLVDCDETRNLFDIKGELDSVSKCRKMAFCLGLIDRLSFDNTGAIAIIRNKFAHSHEPVDFKNEEVIGLCNTLDLDDPTGRGFDTLNLTPRDKFCTVVAGEWEHMFVNGLNTEHRKELGRTKLYAPISPANDS